MESESSSAVEGLVFRSWGASTGLDQRSGRNTAWIASQVLFHVFGCRLIFKGGSCKRDPTFYGVDLVQGCHDAPGCISLRPLDFMEV